MICSPARLLLPSAMPLDSLSTCFPPLAEEAIPAGVLGTVFILATEALRAVKGGRLQMYPKLLVIRRRYNCCRRICRIDGGPKVWFQGTRAIQVQACVRSFPKNPV